MDDKQNDKPDDQSGPANILPQEPQPSTDFLGAPSDTSAPNSSGPVSDTAALASDDKLSVTDDVPSLAPEPVVDDSPSSLPQNPVPVSEPENEDINPQVAPSPLEVKESAESAPEQSNPSMAPATAMGAAASSAHGSGKKNPMIMLVLIVALLLIAGAVYIFIVKRDKTSTSNSSNTQSAAVATDAASPEDITSATADIDSALNEVNDTKDFATSDLSDASLGL